MFQGSNGAEYWLFFELDTRELPTGQLERLGYKAPVVVERQVGLPLAISWEEAKIMLHQMRPLAPDASSLKWLDVMETTAEAHGRLPTQMERTLQPLKF